MALDADDKKEIALMMAEALASAQSPADTPIETPTPTASTPPTEPAPALSAADMAKIVQDAMKDRSDADGNTAMEFMYNKAKGSADAIPGFDKYLEGEDDAHGKPRAEILDAMPVNERLEALERMSTRFQDSGTAQRITAEPNAPLSPAAKVAQDFEKKYEDLDAKWKAGDFDSQAEYTTAHADLIAEEMQTFGEFEG